MTVEIDVAPKSIDTIELPKPYEKPIIGKTVVTSSGISTRVVEKAAEFSSEKCESLSRVLTTADPPLPPPLSLDELYLEAHCRSPYHCRVEDETVLVLPCWCYYWPKAWLKSKPSQKEHAT